MKKFLIALLVLLYLAVSSGLAINIHYCMGKVASAGFYHNYSGQCGKCGMKSGNDSCCKDEFTMVKLNDSHQLFNNDINISVPLALLNAYRNNFDADLRTVQLFSQVHNNSPPDSDNPSLYILHCVFRI